MVVIEDDVVAGGIEDRVHPAHDPGVDASG